MKKKLKSKFGYYDAQGIRLINCVNTTLRDLHLSWQKIPFFQGTVLDVDGPNGTAIVQQDPGTLRPDDPCYFNHQQMLVCPMFSPQGEIYTPASFMFYARKSDDLGNGKFRVYMDTTQPYYTHAKMKIGYKLLIPDRNNYYHAASMCYTAFCNFENITIRTSRAGAFSVHRGYMSSFSNCRIYPLPGMMLSTNADGLINSPGTYMANCQFSNMSDDGFNTHIRGVLISRTDRNNAIVHNNVGRRLPGDRMLLVNPSTGQYFSNIHVKDGSRFCQWRNEQFFLTEFEEKLPEKLKTYDNLNLGTITEEQRKLITHNLVKVKSEPDQLYAPNGDGIGSVVTGCKFYSIRNNGIVVQGANTLIENNTLKAINWTGINIGALVKYQEGPPPYNIIIRNNKIEDVSLGFSCKFEVSNSKPAETAPIVGVCLENNEIRNASKMMLNIYNMSASVIRNNQFYGKAGMIKLTSCKDLQITGNTLNGQALATGEIDEIQCSNIIIK